MNKWNCWLIIGLLFCCDTCYSGNKLQPVKSIMEEELISEYHILELFIDKDKWCGVRNDLDCPELLDDVDRCCKEHDECPDVMTLNENKHGLSNYGPYSRMNCECDDFFYYCLKNVKAVSSYIAGKLYFNYLQQKCFHYEYPMKCIEYEREGWFWGRTECTEWEADKLKGRQWRWRKLKVF